MRQIRVVLDTNVIVSAHLNSEGHERHVLDLALAGKLQLVASEPIFEEYEGVLVRPSSGSIEGKLGARCACFELARGLSTPIVR